MHSGRVAVERPHKSRTKATQKPHKTITDRAEQNKNKTATKNGIFLVGKPSFEARVKLENSRIFVEDFPDTGTARLWQGFVLRLHYGFGVCGHDNACAIVDKSRTKVGQK